MTLRDLGNSIVSAVAGVVIGLVVGRSLPQSLEGWIERGALCVIALLLGLLLVYTGRILSAVIHNQEIQVLSASSNTRTEIYKAAQRLASGAQNSIRALSYDVGGNPQSYSVDAYFDALEEIIRDKKNAGADFVYHRILQLPPSSTEVTEASVGSRAYKHYSALVPLSRDNSLSNTKVLFSKIPARAQASILIADEREALIGIPQTTKEGIIIALAIRICDDSGHLIKPFTRLFDTIAHGGEEGQTA